MDGTHAIGELFDERYELLCVLGQGATAIVYKAREVALQRLIVLKTIKRHFLKDPTQIKRVKQEIEVYSHLEHPAIARLLRAAVSKDGIAYLVFEYCEGETLFQYMQKHDNPDLLWIIEIFEQLSDGLNYAHNKQIVHRDLKPTNILVCKNNDGLSNKAKILDFGYAKIMDSSLEVQSLTQSGFIFAAANYAAPELFTGAKADKLADQFAFGAMLDECIQHNKEVPSELLTIIKRCTAENRTDRYQSMGEVRSALKASDPIELAECGPNGPQVSNLDAAPASARSWRYKAVLIAVLAWLIVDFVLGTLNTQTNPTNAVVKHSAEALEREANGVAPQRRLDLLRQALKIREKEPDQTAAALADHVAIVLTCAGHEMTDARTSVEAIEKQLAQPIRPLLNQLPEANRANFVMQTTLVLANLKRWDTLAKISREIEGEPTNLRLIAGSALGVALAEKREYDQAIPVLQRSLEKLETAYGLAPSIRKLCQEHCAQELTTAFFNRKQFPEMEIWSRRWLDLATNLSLEVPELEARHCLAVSLLELQKYSEAKAVVSKNLELSRKCHDATKEKFCRAALKTIAVRQELLRQSGK